MKKIFILAYFALSFGISAGHTHDEKVEPVTSKAIPSSLCKSHEGKTYSIGAVIILEQNFYRCVEALSADFKPLKEPVWVPLKKEGDQFLTLP